MVTIGRQNPLPNSRTTPPRNRRLKRLGVLLAIGIIVTAVLTVAYQLNEPNLGPAIPRYPNTEQACYPGRLEAQLIGEAFCGIETRDSYRTVVEYYDAQLPQQGWDKGRWYRNPAGYCYTLLIIENNPIAAGVAPGVTSVAFKLRQAFYSELNHIAPPGCK